METQEQAGARDDDEYAAGEVIPFTHPHHVQFAADMRAAGYAVVPYETRGCRRVPAVHVATVRELQDVIRATEVYVGWEALGTRLVVWA